MKRRGLMGPYVFSRIRFLSSSPLSLQRHASTYIHTGVQVKRTQAHTHAVRQAGTHARMGARTHVHTHAHTYTHARTRAHTHTHTHTGGEYTGLSICPSSFRPVFILSLSTLKTNNMCLSLASNSSETVKVTFIKFSTATASDMGMHHVLIILTLTFIQGQTDLNHENNKCSILSVTIKAKSIKFAVKRVRPKFYTTNASLMTLTFIQCHEYVSNLTTFYFAISRPIFKLLHSNVA